MENEEIVEVGESINWNKVVSTGSTLLDLAISGGKRREGGIPFGILVEIFGPNGSGKTVLLSELAGGVQRLGGSVVFYDPEARLDLSFARKMGLDSDNMDYSRPSLVKEFFSSIRKLKSSGETNGIFADSLAALSTDLEMEGEEGDKMGTRRAKEFSAGFRTVSLLIKEKGYLVVCSNQVRMNVGAGPFEQKYITPGGYAMGFYASLRLRVIGIKPLRKQITVKGQKVSRTEGVQTTIEVYKSSIWRPYLQAPVTIMFDYGVDDIRGNLEFVKKFSGESVYTLGNTKLDRSIKKSIEIIEMEGLAGKLKGHTIDLWNEIESKFGMERKDKER